MEARRLVDEANQGPLRARRHCLAVALDARNAFNSLPWPVIVKALVERGVPGYLVEMIASYLEDRQLVHEEEEGGRVIELTGEIPQGSVLGPLLWNVAVDGVFRLPLPKGADIIGFADDLLLIIRGREIGEVRRAAQVAVEGVARWLESKGVKVASQKTTAAWLARRRAGRTRDETIQLLGQEVPVGTSMRYLGIIIEANPRCTRQVEEAAAGAARAIKAVGGLLANIGGPNEGTRRLLVAVGAARLFYAAPAWEKAVESRRNADRLRKAMRMGTLRTIRGYRTISTDAAEVLASTPPADLTLLARARAYGARKRGTSKTEAKRMARDRMMEEWQQRWSDGAKGQWTRSLIPRLEPWVERKIGELDYFLTQLLSGHGNFAAYLHNIGKLGEGACKWCPEEDDARHTLLHCGRWAEERERMVSVLGELREETLITTMMTSEEKWQAVAEFAKKVIMRKEEVMAQRNEEPGQII